MFRVGQLALPFAVSSGAHAIEGLFLARRSKGSGTINVTIRNGLYHIRIEFLDGIQGGNQGVMVREKAKLAKTNRVGVSGLTYADEL